MCPSSAHAGGSDELDLLFSELNLEIAIDISLHTSPEANYSEDAPLYDPRQSQINHDVKMICQAVNKAFRRSNAEAAERAAIAVKNERQAQAARNVEWYSQQARRRRDEQEAAKKNIMP